MWSRPRGLFFWICLIIVLFTVATDPAGFAHLLTDVVRGTLAFFHGLRTFLATIQTA